MLHSAPTTPKIIDALVWQIYVFTMHEQNVTQGQYFKRSFVVFWTSTRPKMPFQGDAPEGSDTF